MGKNRQERFANLLKREIGTMLLNDLHDTRLARVVVTDCRVSPDIRHARIYYTLLGDEEREAAREESEEGLASACSYIRRRLGGILTTKHTPDLIFEYDETLDQARRMENILASIGAESETETETENEGL